MAANTHVRDAKDHSLTGQRMASRTLQESPKVKTVCSKVGSCVFSLPGSLLPRARAYLGWNTVRKLAEATPPLSDRKSVV